jgi:hypothetical protein
MQTEQQIHPAEMPVIAPQADSKESKRRGGKRPGAGRRPNLAKRLLKGSRVTPSLWPSRRLTLGRSSLAC